MLVNKHKYSIRDDQKLLHKVGKQWVVVSAFVLALLGAKGVTTLAHANTVPDDKSNATLANQLNQGPQSAHSLVAQQSSTALHANSAQSSSSVNQNVMQDAKNLHSQIIANGMRQRLTANPSQSQNSLNNNQQPSLKSQNNVNNIQNHRLLGTKPSVITSKVPNNSKLTLNQPLMAAVPQDQPTMNGSYHDKIIAQGYWGTNKAKDAQWKLDSAGTLTVFGGGVMASQTSDAVNPGTATWPLDLSDQMKVRKMVIQSAKAPFSTYGLCDGGGYKDGSLMGGYMPNLRVVDVSGLDMNGVKSVNSMFGGAGNAHNQSMAANTNYEGPTPHLQKIIGFSGKDMTVQNLTNMFSGCKDLSYVDISGIDSKQAAKIAYNLSGIFGGNKNLATVKLGPNTYLNSQSTNGQSTWFNENDHKLAHPTDIFTPGSRPGTWFSIPYRYTINYVSMDGDIINQEAYASSKPNTAVPLSIFNDPTSGFDDVPKGYRILPDQYASTNGMIDIAPNDATKDIVVARPWDNGPHSAFYSVDLNGSLNIFGLGSDNKIDTSAWPKGIDPTKLHSIHTNTSQFIYKFPGEDSTVVAPANATALFGNNAASDIDLSGLDISHTANMSQLFGNDQNLSTLSLPSTFDTSSVTNMNGMFAKDQRLHKLTIQSHNTKISDRQGPTDLPKMYAPDVGDPYTSTIPNDFSKGNIGTFYSPEDLPIDVVSYQYKTNTLADQNFSDGYNQTIDVTSKNANLPSDFHLVHPDNNIIANAKNYTVPVTPNRVTDTVQYQYKGKTLNKQNFSGNYANGAIDANYANIISDLSFTVDKNNEPGLPANYHLVSDRTFAYNGGSDYDVNIMPNQVKDTVNYQYDGKTLSTSVPMTGNYYGAQGASDTTFDINSNREPGIPSDYHLVNKDNTFNYTGGSHNVAIVPNQVTDIIDYNYKGNTLSTGQFTGNSVDAQGAKNTSFDVNSSNQSGIPNNYHLVNAHNTFNYNGSNHSVDIAPNQATDTINYQYHGKTLSTTTLTGNNFKANDASDTSVTIDTQNDPKIPGNYHVVNSDQFNYDNGTHNVVIAPNQATDTINYQYNGKTMATYQPIGNNYRAQGTSDTSVTIDGNHQSDMPTGYQLVTPSQTFNYDGGTYNVAIKPGRVTDTVEYQYNGRKLTSDRLTGNNSVAQGASDVSFTIDGQNEPNIPVGYQLINPSQTFNYTGQTHYVAVTPIQQTDTVHYQYDGQTLGTTTSTGNDSRAQGAPNTNFTINSDNESGLPSDYQLVNTNNTFNYDGQTHNVAIEPVQVTDQINYQYNGQTQTSASLTGNNVHAKDAKNTSFTINGKYEPNLPTGYHLTTNSTFNYDGQPHNVDVAPNRDTDTIEYQYNGKTLASYRPTGNDYNATAAGDNTVTVDSSHDTNLPAGYQLVNSTQTFNYDNQTHQVAVTPIQQTDTIDYQYHGNTLSSDTFTGNDYRATAAGNNTINVNKNDDSKIPSNYHLVNANNTFNYDGQTHNVAILPNLATATIHYQYNGKTLATYKTTGNYVGANGASDTTVTISAQNEPNLPAHYHLASTSGNTFDYDNQSDNVAIDPNQLTDTINYQYNGQTVATTKQTGNDFQAQGASDTTITINNNNEPNFPGGYQLVTANNTFSYDGQAHNVAMKPIWETDDVQFTISDVPKGYRGQTGVVTSDNTDYSGNDIRTKVNGAPDTSFVPSNTMKGLPKGFYVLPNQNVPYDGQSDEVKILGDSEVVPVRFVNQNNQQIGNVDYSRHGLMTSDVNLPSTAPMGYQINQGQPTSYRIEDRDVNPSNPSQVKMITIHITGNSEIVPVEYIDQNNNRIGKIDNSRHADVGSSVGLPTTAPDGYTMNAGQPTTYTVNYANVVPANPTQVYPVFIYVSGRMATLRVQYESPTGQPIGNVATESNVRVGDTVNLIQTKFPNNYMLTSGQGDPTHYKLHANDLMSPTANETKVLPVYIVPKTQNLTVNYIDPAHNRFLDTRTVPVTVNSKIYLTNQNLFNNNGANANGSFVAHDSNLAGYRVMPNQDLAPTAQYLASGSYPIYTVNMQGNPVALHVTYYDAGNNNNVGSDVITKNNQGQSAITGDVMTLPTVANANQNGLYKGYTLDKNQSTSYPILAADDKDTKSGRFVKNIIMLAHGDHIVDEAPITVVKIDGAGHVQDRQTIQVPIDGKVGDQITFNSNNFQGYVPPDYTIANGSNPYNHTNYQNYNYTAKMTESDAGTNHWHANSWQNLNGNYWDAQNQCPQVVIQAATGKQIIVNLINQDGQQVNSLTFNNGSYRNAIDIQDPNKDANSTLKNQIPKGYVYGQNNPSMVNYRKQSRTTNINVVGWPETINVNYYDPSFGHVVGHSDDAAKGHVGDTVNLSTARLPQGYTLADPHTPSYLINQADDTNHTGQITRQLDVIADTEKVPVRFVDQNGAQVGPINYQTVSQIGQTNVGLPMAPQGYQYDSSKPNNGNTYNFTADQMDLSRPGLMKQHTVYLTGNDEAVPVKFIDQNGQTVPNGTQTLHNKIGNQISLPNAPTGYVWDDGQDHQYRLTANNISRQPGQMNTVQIYVRTNQTYHFNVIENEKVNGRIIGSVMVPNNVTGSDGYAQVFKPGDYVPAGFTSEKGNSDVTTKITDTGLTISSKAWTYDAKNSANTTDQNNHLDPQPIILTYYDTDTNKPLFTKRIDGETNQQITIDNPHDGVAVPNGYALNANQRTVYPITTTLAHVTLNVHGIHNNVHDFLLNVVRERHDGTTLTTPYDMVKSGKVDSSFQIKPSDYVPNGYHLDTSAKHRSSDQIVNSTITPDDLTPDNHTFYYAAGYSGNHQDGVQPIHVTYYDDRTGAEEGTNVVNGYMDQTFNVSQLGTAGMTKGYTVDNNQNKTYTISTQPTVAHVMVHGNASTNQDKRDQVTITSYREDPYGNILPGEPETIYDVVTGNVGDKYDITANDYLPGGYHLDTRKSKSRNGDQDLKGTIQNDGSIDHKAVTFYYEMPDSTENNLQPIHVVYEDYTDQPVNQSDVDSHEIAEKTIQPSMANDDYLKKFVNVVADNDADNQQSPVPKGYDVDNLQDTEAAFSNVKPTYIAVMIHADAKSKRYTDVFEQAEKLYDGDQLVRTVMKPVSVTNVNGHDFTMDAPQMPDGYTAAKTNPAKVDGHVEYQRLNPSDAVYRFDATHSAPQLDGKSDQAQPIFVTYKHGNLTIGKSDQRVDGYMDQSINLTQDTQFPANYRLAPNTQTNYAITTAPQHLTIQVTPTDARNASIIYKDQDTNRIITQRSISAPVDTVLNEIASRYTEFVPYGTAFASADWGPDTKVENNGQYVIYVANQHDRQRPFVKSMPDQNSGRIDVEYWEGDHHVISTKTLFASDGAPFYAGNYITPRNSSGQMPNNFTLKNPDVISGEINHFEKGQIQTMMVHVQPVKQSATAQIVYEDTATHQLINWPETTKPIRMTVKGNTEDVMNYSQYTQFVPQGYAYYGMGTHDDALEDGDVDVIMVKKAKPTNIIDQINVVYHSLDSDRGLDSVAVRGIDGSPFNLSYYENDLPDGYRFAGVNKNDNVIAFNGKNNTVTINVRKPPRQPNKYGSITIHFVKASNPVVSRRVNGNQDTPDNTLQKAMVTTHASEKLTGRIGDLFNPVLYEHDTPENTTFDHIVKGNNINQVTDRPQDLWIAVHSNNGRF